MSLQAKEWFPYNFGKRDEFDVDKKTDKKYKNKRLKKIIESYCQNIHSC